MINLFPRLASSHAIKRDHRLRRARDRRRASLAAVGLVLTTVVLGGCRESVPVTAPASDYLLANEPSGAMSLTEVKSLFTASDREAQSGQDAVNTDAANEDAANEDAVNEDAVNEDAANEDAVNEDKANEDASSATDADFVAKGQRTEVAVGQASAPSGQGGGNADDDVTRSVVLAGQIDAGDFDPFDADAAVFVVSELPDPAHASSSDDPEHADNCPFCKRRRAKAPKAMIRICTSDGQPVGENATSLVGLSAGDTVVCRGEASFDPATNMITIDVRKVFRR